MEEKERYGKRDRSIGKERLTEIRKNTERKIGKCKYTEKHINENTENLKEGKIYCKKKTKRRFIKVFMVK